MSITEEDLALDTNKFIERENAKFNLSFRDLNYSVRSSFFSNDKKKIISNVSGNFRAGELTAIMGPSGAGKTILMDILAGYVTKSVKGDIMINGKVRNLNVFRRLSAYIMQYHVLHDLLTVQESMYVAAELKVSGSKAYKKERINVLLKDLGLYDHRMTFAGNLSGGQKKRLAIAMELISDLPIMFFDEPTSGLDSVATKQCIDLMKSLAQAGRMVICTIHQPSASIFNLMDIIYVIAKGHCIYTGSPDNVIPFLSSVNLHCPEYHNPADFLMEVASGEYGDHIVKLSKVMKNSKSYKRQKSISDQPNSSYESEKEMEVGPKHVLNHPILRQTHCDCKLQKSSSYACSSWTQIRVLLWRYLLKTFRDREYIMQILIAHLVMAVVAGLTFQKVGQEASRVIDNVKQLDFNMLFISFCAINSALITFPAELPIMTREYFNRWYKLRSVYIANNIMNFAIVAFAVTIYTAITYYLSDQLPELRRLGYLTLSSIGIALVTQVIGLLISVNLNVKNVVFLGPYSVTPFTLFSGIFIRQRDVHRNLRWLYDISVFRYAYEAFMKSIYGFDRARMKCKEDYCHFSSPNKILNFMDVNDADYWFSTILLFVVFFTLHVLTYICLRIKLKTTKFR